MEGAATVAEVALTAGPTSVIHSLNPGKACKTKAIGSAMLGLMGIIFSITIMYLISRIMMMHRRMVKMEEELSMAATVTHEPAQVDENLINNLIRDQLRVAIEVALHEDEMGREAQHHPQPPIEVAPRENASVRTHSPHHDVPHQAPRHTPHQTPRQTPRQTPHHDVPHPNTPTFNQHQPSEEDLAAAMNEFAGMMGAHATFMMPPPQDFGPGVDIVMMSCPASSSSSLQIEEIDDEVIEKTEVPMGNQDGDEKEVTMEKQEGEKEKEVTVSTTTEELVDSDGGGVAAAEEKESVGDAIQSSVDDTAEDDEKPKRRSTRRTKK